MPGKLDGALSPWILRIRNPRMMKLDFSCWYIWFIFMPLSVIPCLYIESVTVFDGILISSLCLKWSHLFDVLASLGERRRCPSRPACQPRFRPPSALWTRCSRSTFQRCVKVGSLFQFGIFPRGKNHDVEKCPYERCEPCGQRRESCSSGARYQACPWMVDLGISHVFCTWRDRCPLLLKKQMWYRMNTCFQNMFPAYTGKSQTSSYF